MPRHQRRPPHLRRARRHLPAPRRPPGSATERATERATEAPEERPTWTARDEVDLVAIVPQVLGFHPRDSVVVLSFGGPQPFHARADLPEVAAHRVELAGLLARACADNRAERAAAVIYTDDHERARAQGEDLVTALHAAGLDVVDVLRVDDGRWFEPLREDGPGTPYDLSTHPLTAQAVFEGRAVHADREELRATLDGVEGPERERLARSAALRRCLLTGDADPAALPREAAWVRARVRRAVLDGDPLDTGDAARLLVAVVRGDLRDAAWVDLRRAEARAHVALWSDLVRRAPRELLPPVCGLLALAAYLAGDGALAWCAVDRAREVSPRHSLVDLVADTLAQAVPPSAWPVPSAGDLPLLAGGPAGGWVP